MSPIPERLIAVRAGQVADAATLIGQVLDSGLDLAVEDREGWREQACDVLEPLGALERELRDLPDLQTGTLATVVVEVEGPGGHGHAEDCVILRWDGRLAGVPRPTIGGQTGSTIDPGGDAPALIAETVDYCLDGTVYVECQNVTTPPHFGAADHLRAAGFRGYNEPKEAT